MSRFFSNKYSSLEPYTPGEQPKDRVLLKLNTNESPFPPAPAAIAGAAEAARDLRLYSDPDCRDLRRQLAETYSRYSIAEDEILCCNGSDEGLNFAFMAYCDEDRPAAFPALTYGFYPVFADINGIEAREIPLKADMSIDPSDYYGLGATIFIPNPNAPTGIALPQSRIRDIVSRNPDSIVVIDEAYVDFGTESSVPLIHEFDNLLVVQTSSKSRSLAGARLGWVFGSRELIADLNALRFSTNPYNLDRMAMAAGIGALADAEYMENNCRTIMENRQYTADRLKEMGFEMTESKANFLFIRHPEVEGKELFIRLRGEGIIIRHWDNPLIVDYNRVTIGTRQQMDQFLEAVERIIS